MPALLVLQGPDKGRRFAMAEGTALLVGRASRAMPLTDYTVSRRHAELRPIGRGWAVEDLKSANGTYLNGRRLERSTRLRDGDQIRIGGTLLVWDGSEGGSTQATGSDVFDLDAGGLDRATIIDSVGAGDDSMILASPVAAEAVRSWRVISTLLDAVGAALSPAQLVQRVLDVVFEEVPADRGLILLEDEKTGEFEIEAALPADAAGNRGKVDARLTEHVIRNKEGILCSNAMSDERFKEPGGKGLEAIGLKSVIAVPMIAHEIVLGVIYVDCAMAKHIYTEEQLRLVAAIGRMAGLAIEDAKLVNERMRTERLAAAGETVAALSHYIKNILQGLKGGSDIIEMGLRGKAIDTVDQGWDLMRRSLDNIFALTMNMLAFAKRREPRRAPVQLAGLMQDVLKLVRPRAEDKGVQLNSEIDDAMPPIQCDEHGIHQVALNIISNAVDAVEKTVGVVNVKLDFDADTQMARIAVGDNGAGIPDDLRERIFDAFYSTKGHGGTGLGLAVARKIIDEHGGQISVQSVKDAGTLIRVSLPAAPPGAHLESAETHGPLLE